jgi:hypothetical protein
MLFSPFDFMLASYLLTPTRKYGTSLESLNISPSKVHGGAIFLDTFKKWGLLVDNAYDLNDYIE